MKVSDYVAQLVEQTGVKHVFTVSGAGNLHLLHSLDKSRVKIVPNHHEQASAMCMESYSRATNNYGVCTVTFGPGSTNTITGVAGAWMDSIPCMVISGQSKYSDTIQGQPLRQRGVQEIDIVSIVKTITKYAVLVTSADSIRYHFEKALFLSRFGRPGPVWLDIPMDIQAQQVEPGRLKSFDPAAEGYAPSTPANYEGALDEIVALLRKAERPILLAGAGIRLAGGAGELNELIAELQIPTLTSWNAADLLPSDHPCYAGRAGTYGQRGANFALQNCDLLISVGARLSIPQTGYRMEEFCRAAKKVAIDIDPAELGKFAVPLDLTLAIDAKRFLADLLRKVRGGGLRSAPAWGERCRKWRDDFPTCLPEYFKTAGAVNSYVFVEKLSERLAESDTVVTDMGTSFTCVHQTIRLKKGQRFFTSSGLASMGFGLPGAIGACFAKGRTRTICLVGDGAFQMNVQELELLKFHDLPLKVFVLNNSGYLTIKQTQNAMFEGRHVASSPAFGVTCPSSLAVAKAYGIDGAKISSIDEMRKVLDETFDKPGPFLYEVIMPEDQLLVPKSSIEVRPDGSIVSRPLEDLYPFIDRETFDRNMIIPPLPASREPRPRQ